MTKKQDKTNEEIKSAKKIEDLDVNARQELFCQLYVSKEFFGNGVQTYIEAYDPDQSKPNWYKTAMASSSRLLTNVKVLARINELLDDSGLNDAFVDKQLLMLMTQNADFTNKLGAMKEYNKLKSRITEKVDLSSKGEKIGGFIVVKTVKE